jgi:hypothetical protein
MPRQTYWIILTNPHISETYVWSDEGSQFQIAPEDQFDSVFCNVVSSVKCFEPKLNRFRRMRTSGARLGLYKVVIYEGERFVRTNKSNIIISVAEKRAEELNYQFTGVSQKEVRGGKWQT